MIREAEPKDAKSLEKLFKTLAPNSKNIDVLPERVEQIKQDLNNFLFVYEDEDTVLGTVLVTLCLDPMYQFRPFAVIENFIVDENRRGNGIGSLLIGYVEEFCKSKSCTKMMIMSNSERVEAHLFFEQRGFKGSISKGFKKYLRITNS